MSHLSDALSALGYKTNEQQVELIQLYYASGALTEGTIPIAVMNDEDAKLYITNPRLTFNSPSEALEWFNKIGQEQRARFRPIGTERQQMTSPQDLQKHQDAILKQLNSLGFLSEVVPSKPEVAALMILGAAEGGVTARFNAAAQMIEESKIKPEKILLVSGARDLWPNDSSGKMKGEASTLDLVEQRIRESGKADGNIREALQKEFDQGFKGIDPAKGSDVAKARAEIARKISEEYSITWPTEADMMAHIARRHPMLKEFDIEVVNAPKIHMYQGQKWILERPNTQSTVEETVRQCGQQLMSKDVAVMSSQPHSTYQQSVVEGIMGPHYRIQMAAPGIKLEKANPIEGIEAVFTSVYASKEKAAALLYTQEAASYRSNWQEYITQRRNVEQNTERVA